MATSAGGPPPTQERPEWLPKPHSAVVVGEPPPSAPPPIAPPPSWQPPPPARSRLPLVAGVGVIALVLIAGGYWLLRDSTLFQQAPSAYLSIAAPGAPPSKPKDMEGKTVGVQAGTEYLLKAFAKKNGHMP